ncbi:MAG: methyltransferase domain-containing protein, partial [Alphaproteobacteria bacterium]|nr:methyltransferase domain-containing protein [Alphaproteobacteria bacterium]
MPMARFMPQLPDRYFANVNPDLLAAIPFNAGKVLEIGAGAGALGAAFKRRHPACLWVGVEVVSEAAEHASSLLDEVYVADIELVLAKDKHERPDWLSSTATYDAIVFGDVLEHLKDPWAVLRALSDYLADDGVVLACIPNVGHWTIIESLLRGQFQYTDAGLLDRTHLRFFTAATMLESFRAAAL